MKENSQFEVNPDLGRDGKDFRRFCLNIANELNRNTHVSRMELVEIYRTHLYENHTGGKVALAVAQSIILDLIAQDWAIEVRGNKVLMNSPAMDDKPVADVKEQVRNGHLLERNSKLREPAVIGFIKAMESRRLTPTGWHSIHSLMRDGSELSAQLEQAATEADENKRESLLSQVIQPYIQFAEGDAVCEHTGLPLKDIWRYFRYTWVNVHKSIPGRSMMILIRDAGTTNHPVIGIAALGSSVVQQAIRDRWIGWDSDTFVNELMQKPSRKVGNWLSRTLEESISEIYLKDLISEGLISRVDIRKPSDEVISALRVEADGARKQHRLFPHANAQKGNVKHSGWEERARTNLFLTKRCVTLATLLNIKKIFIEEKVNLDTKAGIQYALQKPRVRSAIKQLVRFKKGSHVGIDMMDITVCGAIAPYNAILGGKLVCMLLASPEVARHYNQRYSEKVSIIASSMKGKPVIRKPKLALLTTTSLYGRGSSQYNRVKIPLSLFGLSSQDAVEYKQLGLSEGFGSFHFSGDTLRLIETLLPRRDQNRKVNSIFGEGVNPLMRKIRDALNHLHLPAERILKHGFQRIVYGVSLATNLREVMLGIDSQPKYLLPQTNPSLRSQQIVTYWIKRWLCNRVMRNDVLQTVASHTLIYPIRHSALVSKIIATDVDTPLPLFSKEIV